MRVWKPRKGWTTVAGSALHGPNGIEVSRNGKTLYVSEWVTRKIVSVPVKGGTPKVISKNLPFLPDNLRWSASRKLLVTGQDNDGEAAVIACETDTTKCPPGFTVVEVDPHRKKAKTIFSTDMTEFRYSTVAAPVGRDLWIGTNKIDAIAVVSGLRGSRHHH